MRNLNFYCVIPARAGSKRIPNKNIQLVGDKPLISHVIENALRSSVFKEVFVSTDSQQIADIAIASGAKVPELRDESLSNDFVPTRPVIADFILRNRELQGEKVVICCIYPFAMLVSPQALSDAADLVYKLDLKNKYLVSVKKYPHPIQRALVQDKTGFLSAINPHLLEKRTQDLPEAFHDAGQFYFAFSKTWTIDSSVLANAFGYELSRLDSVDVDSVEDLDELRRIYAIRNSGSPDDKLN